jgi:hypothetical protein
MVYQEGNEMANPKTEVDFSCRAVNQRTGEPCTGKRAIMSVIQTGAGRIVRYVCKTCNALMQINQGGAAF